MRRYCMVEQQRILDLASIPNDTIVADDHILAQIRIMANLTVFSNDRRPFDHSAILDHSSFSNEDVFSYERNSLAAIVKSRTQVRLQVSRQLCECLPSEFAAVKNFPVLCLAQLKQIRCFEHVSKLGESSR